MAEASKQNVAIGDVSWISVEVNTLIEDVITYLGEYINTINSDKDTAKAISVLTSCLPLLEQASLTLEFVNAIAGSKFCNKTHTLFNNFVSNPDLEVKASDIIPIYEKLQEIPNYLQRIVKLKEDIPDAFNESTFDQSNTENNQPEYEAWQVTLSSALQNYKEEYASKKTTTETYKNYLKKTQNPVMSLLLKSIKQDEVQVLAKLPDVFLTNAALASNEAISDFWAISSICLSRIHRNFTTLTSKLKKLVGDIGKQIDIGIKNSEDEHVILLQKNSSIETILQLLRICPEKNNHTNALVSEFNTWLQPRRDDMYESLCKHFSANYDETEVRNFNSLLDPVCNESKELISNPSTRSALIAECSKPYFLSLQRLSPFLLEALSSEKHQSKEVFEDLSMISQIFTDTINTKQETISLQPVDEDENISTSLDDSSISRIQNIIDEIKLVWLVDRNNPNFKYEEWFDEMNSLLLKLVSGPWSDDKQLIELQDIYQDLQSFFEVARGSLTWNVELNNSFSEMISGLELVVLQFHADSEKLNDVIIMVGEALAQFKKAAVTQAEVVEVRSNLDDIDDEFKEYKPPSRIDESDKYDENSYKTLSIRGGPDVDLLVDQFVEEATEAIPSLISKLQTITEGEFDEGLLINTYDLLQRLASGATLISCDLFSEFAEVVSDILKYHIDNAYPVHAETSKALKSSTHFIPQLINQIAGNTKSIPDIYTFFIDCQKHLDRDRGVTISQISEAGLIPEESTDFKISDSDEKIDTDTIIDGLLDITARVEQGEALYSTPQFIDLLKNIHRNLFSTEDIMSPIALNYQQVQKYAESRLEDGEIWNKRAIIMLTMLTRSIFGFSNKNQNTENDEISSIDSGGLDQEIILTNESDSNTETAAVAEEKPLRDPVTIDPTDPLVATASQNEIPDEITQIFLEESQELISSLFSLVSNITKSGLRDYDLQEFRRFLHTLKGSANMVGLTQLGKLFHLLEDVAIILVERPNEAYKLITSEIYEIINWFSVNDIKIIKGLRGDEVDYYITIATAIVKRFSEMPIEDDDSDVIGNEEKSEVEPQANFQPELKPATEQDINSVSITSIDNNFPITQINEQSTSATEIPAISTIASAVENKTPSYTSEALNPTTIDISSTFVTEQSDPSEDTKFTKEFEDERILLSLESMRDLIESSSEVKVIADSNEDIINRCFTDIRELSTIISQLSINASDLVTVADTNIKASYDEQLNHQPRNMKVEFDDNYDPLELDEYNEVQQLSRVVSEGVNDLREVLSSYTKRQSELSESLQREKRVITRVYKGLMNLHMSDAQRFIANLRFVTTKTARIFSKSVSFKSSGGDLQIDRQILKKVTVAGEHILRNAIIHGIEIPEERKKLGKLPEGSVSVNFSREGPYIKIVLEDDGAGINVPKLREKLESLNIIQPDQKLSDREIIKNIFLQNVTTAEKVDTYSGRGVGMNIVRDIVHELSGLIEIHNQPGKGCAFMIRIPFSLNLAQLIVLKSGDLQYGALYSIVKTQITKETEEINDLFKEKKSFIYEDKSYVIFKFSTLIRESSRGISQKMSDLVLFENLEGINLAIWVDSAERTGDLAIKSLGRQISSLGYFIGGTFLESGKFLFIVSLSSLYNLYLEEGASSYQDTNTDIDRKKFMEVIQNTEDDPLPLIMVVDDSITIRKYLKMLLNRNNYDVLTANDGAEALEKLKSLSDNKLPRMIITDIEMPVIDGLELAKLLHNEDVLNQIPLTIITSRMAAKHRTTAESFNVKYFFGKPFNDDELISKVKELIGTKA